MGHRRHRRQMIVLLAATLALLGWLVWGMITDLRNRPVSYRVQHITPVNSYLCPGDTLLYEVEVKATDVPVVLSITEAWCQSGVSGVCSQELIREYAIPVLQPRHIYVVASRVVPMSEWFEAGREYEFWHATSNDDRTAGYVVGPVIIRDNCEGP